MHSALVKLPTGNFSDHVEEVRQDFRLIISSPSDRTDLLYVFTYSTMSNLIIEL
ncbi:hypothetical protein LC653_07255 [Nostoc sp. CHAB 5784]|nr:hypothetical protein [Nostoc mirabile CHAB5784]